MAKKEVRLQYSGFIIFAAKMLSIATGMIFTLLLTRNTNSSQFGTWSNVFDVIGYFGLLSAAIPFWTTRFVARNKEGSTKTGLVANSIIGLVSVLLYLPLIPFIISALGSQAYIALYFIASTQIIGSYLINQLEATLRAERPQAVGYGLLVEEIIKITLAYVLIVILQQPLMGAMISLTIGILIQVIYYLKLVAPDLNQKTQWHYVREWLKGSIANIYYLIGNQIASTILIMLFVLGSSEARGYFQVADTITNIITYASFLSFALYPKLLARKSLDDITASLRTVLMFAIPMLVGIMAIPTSLLIVLNPLYANASSLLLILAADAFIQTISGFYQYVLFGFEKLDEDATVPIRQLVRSDMFKAFSLTYIHAAITLPLAYYFLTNFKQGEPVQAALYVGLITMFTRLAMFLVLYVLVRKTVKVVVPWKSIGKYMTAAAIMGSVLYLIPPPTKLALTLATAAGAGIFYIALLLVFDREARALVRSVLEEIRGKFK